MLFSLVIRIPQVWVTLGLPRRNTRGLTFLDRLSLTKILPALITGLEYQSELVTATS
jgi:hypothetical protein